MKRRLSSAFLIGLVATIVLASSAEAAKSKMYSVIFGVVVNESGELVSFRVAQVVDPASRSTAPVKVAVPDSFIAAARKLTESKKPAPRLKDGKPVEFFTYYFFDPSEPERADLSP